MTPAESARKVAAEYREIVRYYGEPRTKEIFHAIADALIRFADYLEVEDE